MILLPASITTTRHSRSSRPDSGSSQGISAGSNAPTTTGARKGATSAVIAMVFTISTIPNTSIADSVEYQEADFAEAVQLSTSEILETFSDTLDRGAVQSKRGISAETRWLLSGGFETRWWRETGEAPKINVVSGRWKAENNKRCVLFQGAPVGEWQCTPVFRRADGAIISLNGDGSVHGVHQIAPLELSAEDPH